MYRKKYFQGLKYCKSRGTDGWKHRCNPSWWMPFFGGCPFLAVPPPPTFQVLPQPMVMFTLSILFTVGNAKRYQSRILFLLWPKHVRVRPSTNHAKFWEGRCFKVENTSRPRNCRLKIGKLRSARSRIY